MVARDVSKEDLPSAISLKALLSSGRAGRFRIRGVLLSTSSLRVCAFEAKAGIFSRKPIYLDPSATKFKGGILVIGDLRLPSRPTGCFSIGDQGWVLDQKEQRFGDVMDILVDKRLAAMEIVVALRHELVVRDDVLKTLPKEMQRAVVKEVPDVSSPVTGNVYTIASLPASKVRSVRTCELFYEIITAIDLDDLSNSFLASITKGEREKGLLRRIFEEQISS